MVHLDCSVSEITQLSIAAVAESLQRSGLQAKNACHIVENKIVVFRLLSPLLRVGQTQL